MARRSASGSISEPTNVSTSPTWWCGECSRSKIRGVTPCSLSLSTTCEPMKPEPPVTRTLICLTPLVRFLGTVRVSRTVVIERDAPVVLGDPIGVRQVDLVTHDPVARLVVDLAGGLLDG